MKYNLELVKTYLDKSDYEALNNILYAIMNNEKHTLEDLQILELLSTDPRIDKNSAEIVKEYKNKVAEELKENKIEETKKEEKKDEQQEQNKEELEQKKEKKEETIEEVQSKDVKPISKEEEQRIKYEEEYKNYLAAKFVVYGLTIKELSFSKNEPHITFDNNPASRNVIDNLMLNLYQNAKDIPNLGFDLTKLWTTGEESFTVSLLPGQELNNNSVVNMFQNVEKIVDDTKKDKDYEELLPDNLKNMKSLYSGHMPDMPNEDFRVGYVNYNGEDNFYVVSNSKEKSIKLTEEMGFTPRTIGNSNVVEIDTENKNSDKLSQVSEDLPDAIKKEPPEKAKVYTLKPNPNNITTPNAAYSNIKNIILIIVLIIIVIIAVSIMTLRG